MSKMEVRQRKLKSQNGRTNTFDLASRSKKANKQLGRKYLSMVILFGTMLLGYLAIANDIKPVRIGRKALDSLAFSFSLQKPVYAVIIDAGSTGSRVLAFSFHESILDGNIILDSELFYQVKPGLSSFANDPKKGAQSLVELLDKAKTVIPKSEWPHTPLSMKATAGLRLLPEERANNLLEECRKLFDASGFQVSKKSVSIMEGVDEGIFSWFTVNFLLDRLSAHNAGTTVAALDLGGGSTQVTFAPDDANIKNQEKYIYSIKAFDHNMSIYTHSYLGMGLMAARKEILTFGNAGKEINDGIIEVRSECINPLVKTEWSYGGHNYLVRGPENGTRKTVKSKIFAGVDEENPVVRFPECLKIVKNYVATIPNKPLGLQSHEIYAFSYYFDRATEVGLIDPFSGDVITVDAFLKSATESCDDPNVEQPFTCLDLTFIYVLLRDGFGLESGTKLSLYKKISGHELSWALGAAFNILQNGL